MYFILNNCGYSLVVKPLPSKQVMSVRFRLPAPINFLLLEILVMKFPWYFYLALKQLFPSRKFFSFFSFLSILGVSIGVCVMIVVQSAMGGIGKEIQSKMVAISGDIQISSQGILYNYKEIGKILNDLPAIKAHSPFAMGVVLLKHQNYPTFPFVRGIDPKLENKVIPIDQFLLKGNIENLDQEAIFVSSGLARSLSIKIGDWVEVYTPLLLEKIKKDEILLPRELQVRAIYECDWQQADQNSAFVHLHLLQDLYNLGNRGLHGISLKIEEGQVVDQVTSSLNKLLPQPLIARSWLDMNRDFLFVLRLEKNLMFFLMIFIIIVGSFSITIALSMSVVRKTREIGLLAAMGASSKQIAATFAFQGFLIGTIGTLVGLILGVSILSIRNEIVYFIAKITQSEAALLRFYQFTDIPVFYQISDFIKIGFFSIFIATLAGLLPAWRAARLMPAVALRG